jgi:hypothetical protein
VVKARGAELTLIGDELVAAQERHNQGAKQRKGQASILEKLARSPKHGSAPIKKTELAEPMAELILQEIHNAGDWRAVAENRPILKWVMDYPVRAYRTG